MDALAGVLVVLIVAIAACYVIRMKIAADQQTRRDRAANEQALKYLENEGMTNRVRIEQEQTARAQIEQQTAREKSEALYAQLQLVSGLKKPGGRAPLGGPSLPAVEPDSSPPSFVERMKSR